MTANVIAAPLPAEWRDFFALTKPRVMSLVIFTGLCGLLAAPGHIHPVLGFTAILCIALGAGGAGGLQHQLTRGRDHSTSPLSAKSGRLTQRKLAGRLTQSTVFLPHFNQGCGVMDDRGESVGDGG